MKNEWIDILKASSRENMLAIWEKAKTGNIKGLRGEEKQIAEIMIEHAGEYHEELETARLDKDYVFDPDDDEVNPFLHIAVHAAIENQLASRDPIEVFQFYNAMRKKKASHHDAGHLVGFLLMPLAIHALHTGHPFDEARYRSLLKKMKKRSPWKIPDLLETEFDDLLEPDLFDPDDLEEIESRDAKQKLDALIDRVDGGGAPVLIRSRNGGEAVLVPLADYQVMQETEALFAEMEAGEMFPELEAGEMFPELEAAKRFPETKKGADIVPFPGKKDAVESESGLPLDPAFKQVLQFKITLKGISPPIWRRLLVPEDHTFWDLHVAIQNAMGWDDMHLHQFELSAGKKRPPVLIGLPSPEFEFETGESLLPGWGCRVSDYLSLENPKANYIYDFGDDWLHAVVLEKVLGRQKGQSYPLCIKGKRACPPEDCGSIPGYYNLVEAMEHPGSEEYEELLEWLGEEYDPDQFNADAIVFSDPRAQLKDVVI